MATEYRDTPILTGKNVAVYPTPKPFWAPEDKVSKRKEGESLKTATTGNVRFNVAVLKAGLRFNEALGLMGGEDNEFFTAAHLAGFEIKRTLRAVTWETAHPARLTYRARMYRAYWCAASETRRLALVRGFHRTALKKAHTIPLNIVFGGFWLIVAALAWPVSRAAFKNRALYGGNRLAKAAGRFAALIGRLPQPYRVIDGD